MTDLPAHIFVYGTLQRGEERQRCWPREPLVVEPAETFGQLYCLGPYPAIVSGSDRVGGELWRLRAEDLEETLRVLDAIECFGQGNVDLYVRRIVACRLANGEEIIAYTYYLLDEDFARRHRRVTPGPDGVCRWHRNPSR